eukprot:gnl/Hemi2/20927_TR6935_c0_g2_i1.p1 gnl/Hemi2/20927_TR6935_c0_g2~~gnl/Hemi2/20927_TR6935_c0_g2_i1.p1  ORF type:complete len:374 (-),score=85.28 gnl/Hemi2/20927_TR6935_c0_g2_i1:88-1209(-)
MNVGVIANGKGPFELLFFNFNQDYSCFSVGTSRNFSIFNCEPFTKCFTRADGGIGVVEMLFCTSLIALVGQGDQASLSPRRLRLWNTKTMSSICDLNFGSAILAVKLNRRRVVVALELKVHIFELSSMKILHTLEIPTNPKGVCALSLNGDNCYLAVPASSTSGEVLIFDTLNQTPVTVIQAHRSPLSHLAFNSDGSLLASSSDTGTVIRVHAVPSGALLHSFRRGTYPASIYCLSFSLSSALLCVSSDSGTVHIFKLTHNSGGSAYSSLPNGGDQTPLSSTKMVTNALQHYLPGVITNILEPTRDFAHLKVPSQGVPNICAVNSQDSQVMVVTADGFFYQYALDVAAGGECRPLKEHTLVERVDELLDAKIL